MPTERASDSWTTTLGAVLRAVAYAALFIAFVLVFLPAQVLQWSPVNRPEVLGATHIAGMIIVVVGGALAVWCILSFAVLGRGTPAPFDPPRRLVLRGPYRLVRNPMYLGAALALVGAALFYWSLPLLAYALAFVFVTHLFVVCYEEPTLRRTFGAEYEAYCQRVPRW